MLGLLLSTVLAVAPPPGPGLQPDLPLALRDDGPAPAPAPAPARPIAEKTPLLTKGERLLLGSGVAYGLGAAIHWTTAGASGMLGDDPPGATSGVTLGMTFGGLGLMQAPVLAGIAGRELARASEGQGHRARPMIAGGAVLTTLGAGALVGSAMLIPTITPRCPIRAGCVLAAGHLGGAVLSAGVGMLAYGHTLRTREPDYRRLSRKVRGPLLGGSLALGTSYLLSATVGMLSWQADPSDPVARRTRDRMLIPVVGPWIHAAGPDAPLFTALVTGGLGAVQIGGAITLAVAGIRAGIEREREAWVRVVPSLDGFALVGAF